MDEWEGKPPTATSAMLQIDKAINKEILRTSPGGGWGIQSEQYAVPDTND